MTKKEKEKCEKLMKMAIQKVYDSKERYADYEKLLKEGNRVSAECKLRLADNELGYAEGINQALAELGFAHKDMVKLSELL